MNTRVMLIYFDSGMMQVSIKCLLIVLIICTFNIRVDGKVVNTPAGRIRGYEANDGNYFMFLGIPYAKIDTSNPFGHSKPFHKFKNIFNADDDSVICPQLENYNNTVQGSLDCLRLNVYVPKTNTSNKFPVMVHITAGGFMRGIAGRYQFGPKFLVRHDVIIVVMSHRFGPYGFLCLDKPEVPGNQGLKDQVLALKWVKDNIESFGGNADQITLFGHSSGAFSIDFHLKYTDGELFKQAILQSGNSFNPTLIPAKVHDHKSTVLNITKHLGKSTSCLNEALSFLTCVDPIAVIKTVNKLKAKFGLCIEKIFDNVNPFITDPWVNVKKSNVKSKNIMLGIHEYEEVREFIQPGDFTRNIFREYLSKSFDFSDETLNEMSDLVKRFYIGDDEISEKVRVELIDFVSDFKTNYPMQRSIKQYLEGEAKNIFYYMFSYVGGRNNGHIKFKFNFNGATHGDEIGYLFDPKFITWNPTSEDQLMVDRITTLWTNFAKYGNPTPEKTKLLPVTWTAVPKDQHYYPYLKIGSNLTMKKSLFHKRMAFWGLFYKLHEKSLKGYVNV